MNYRDELQKQIVDMRSKADNLENWLNSLTKDGFDWDNVTDAQKWAIINHVCPPDRPDVKW